MSSSAAASSYWRVAGMTYLKYSNLCADMVRASLKDPLRTTAKTREAVYFRASTWEDGKPVKQGALPAPAACTLSLSVCSGGRVFQSCALPHCTGAYAQRKRLFSCQHGVVVLRRSYCGSHGTGSRSGSKEVERECSEVRRSASGAGVCVRVCSGGACELGTAQALAAVHKRGLCLRLPCSRAVSTQRLRQPARPLQLGGQSVKPFVKHGNLVIVKPELQRPRML